MSRYVLELNSDILKSIVAFGMMGETGVSTVFKIDELEELNSDYINEHFGDLQDTAYQRGLDDAWNVARKIAVETDDGGVSISALYEMFGTESMCMIMKNNTVYDAADKLKSYEEKQKAKDEIKVGDEVIYNSITKCLVVRPESDERCANLIDSNGNHYYACYYECKKTGRHYDIASILEDMRND